MEDKSKDVDLIIPMIPEMELTASNTAEAVGEFMKLDHDKIQEIKLALIEACINAFEHSQSQDERVNISFEMGENELTIQISDQGQGFDLKRAQEELKKRRQRGERGERMRGWGLTIMRELMDEVEVESDENGTTITMKKQR